MQFLVEIDTLSPVRSWPELVGFCSCAQPSLAPAATIGPLGAQQAGLLVTIPYWLHLQKHSLAVVALWVDLTLTGALLCDTLTRALPQAPLIMAVLLSRFEVELDESMGGVEGMLKRQCNTFTISIDKVRYFT